MSGQDKQEHEIFVKQRAELNVTGVKDVDSFDEMGAVLQTVEGELNVEGHDLKIGILDIDRGIVTVTGRINGIYYSSDRTEAKQSFFARLLK